MTTRINLTLPDDLHAYLLELSEHEDRTLGAQIRQILREHKRRAEQPLIRFDPSAPYVPTTTGPGSFPNQTRPTLMCEVATS